MRASSSMMWFVASVVLLSLSSSFVFGDSSQSRLLVFCGSCADGAMPQPTVVVVDITPTASIGDAMKNIVGVCGLYYAEGPTAVSISLRLNSNIPGIIAPSTLALFNNTDPVTLLGRDGDLVCVDMLGESASRGSVNKDAHDHMPRHKKTNKKTHRSDVIDDNMHMGQHRDTKRHGDRHGGYQQQHHRSVHSSMAIPDVSVSGRSSAAVDAAVTTPVTPHWTYPGGWPTRVLIQCNSSSMIVVPFFSTNNPLVGDVLAEANFRCNLITPAQRLLLAVSTPAPLLFPLENGQYAETVIRDNDIVVMGN